MLTAKDCWDRYGDPETEAKIMTKWDVPPELVRSCIPKRIYCNRDMVKPLTVAFRNLVEQGLVGELKTWDGCWCIRHKRGGSSSLSLHSWGVAIDVNAKENTMGKKPTLSPEVVACFEEAGFDWGGRWHTPDGMHFQLRVLP